MINLHKCSFRACYYFWNTFRYLIPQISYAPCISEAFDASLFGVNPMQRNFPSGFAPVVFARVYWTPYSRFFARCGSSQFHACVNSSRATVNFDSSFSHCAYRGCGKKQLYNPGISSPHRNLFIRSHNITATLLFSFVNCIDRDGEIIMSSKWMVFFFVNLNKWTDIVLINFSGSKKIATV